MKTVIEMVKEVGAEPAYDFDDNEYWIMHEAQIERLIKKVREDFALKYSAEACGKCVIKQAYKDSEKELNALREISDKQGSFPEKQQELEGLPKSWKVTPLYTTPPTAALAARQMRDAAVKVCREAGVTGANEAERFGHTVGVMQCAELVSRLPVPEVKLVDLTDDECLSFALDEGIIDSLCDPYDKFKTGDDYGSVQYDVVRLSQKVITKFKEKQL